MWISEPSRPATLAGPVAAFALVLSRAFDGFIFDVTLRLRPARGDAYETRNCTVTQGAETTLAGECEVNGMTSELTGTVKDMDLRFSITVWLYLHLHGQGARRQRGGRYRSRGCERHVQRQTRQGVSAADAGDQRHGAGPATVTATTPAAGATPWAFKRRQTSKFRSLRNFPAVFG